MVAGGAGTPAATMTPTQLPLEAGAGAVAVTLTPGLAATGESLSTHYSQSGMLASKRLGGVLLRSYLLCRAG